MKKPVSLSRLITVGEAEAKMIQEFLRKQKIRSELHATSIADALAGYAVQGNLFYEVLVPKSLLSRAKKLLNLK